MDRKWLAKYALSYARKLETNAPGDIPPQLSINIWMPDKALSKFKLSHIEIGKC